MDLDRSRFAGALSVAVFAALAGAPEPVVGQTADVAGTWTLSVTTDQGVTTPTWTLEQDGEQLTGSYSSEALGENEVTGTVSGSDVTVRFSASLQGQSIPVVYRGTVADDGTMSGTIDLASGALTGTFTATRSG